MTVETAAAVKAGQALAAPAVRAGWRKLRSWERLVSKDVSAELGFRVDQRRLRKALKRGGIALLTPTTDSHAEAAMDTLHRQLQPMWPTLSDDGGRARTAEIYAAAQRLLLKRLDVNQALDVIDQRAETRSGEQRHMLSEIIESLDSIHSDEDALVANLPADVGEIVLALRPQVPQVDQLAQAITDSSDPAATLIEWARHPPAWFSEGPGTVWLALGQALAAYGQTQEAAEALLRAARQGIPDPGVWRARAALLLRDSDAERASGLVSVESASAFNRAVAHLLTEAWREAQRELELWQPTARFQSDIKVLLLAGVDLQLRDEDRAISRLEAAATETRSAGIQLMLAQLLAARAQRRRTATRHTDLRRAYQLAVRARDARRLWRGDSAEAVALAADSLVLQHDLAGVWNLVRTQPQGQATAKESRDKRVLGKAALAAASTGRTKLARDLAQQVGGFDEAWLTAALAELELNEQREADDARTENVRFLWRKAMDLATDDGQRLLAARGLLLNGGSFEGLDALRESFPEPVREFEELADAVSETSGPQMLAKLRTLRGTNFGAVIRLSEILQQQGASHEAATVLREAADRFDDQYLRLQSASVLADAGTLDEAANDANEVLARTAPEWPGRQQARRIILMSAMNDRRWDDVVAQCTQLIVEDVNDDDARWALASALTALDKTGEAFTTLHRGQTLLAPGNTGQAALMLRLLRSHGDADTLITSTVACLREFGEDEQFAAYALAMVYTGGGDRASEESDPAEHPASPHLAELHAETERFFERFPNSQWFQQITFTDIEGLLQQLGDTLRSGATARRRYVKDVTAGGLPTGFLTSILGRPYALAFPLRVGGGLRIGSPDGHEVKVSVATATRVADSHSSVLITLEASTLNVLAVIDLRLRPLLIGHFPNLRITDSSLADLRGARDSLSLRSSLYSVYDERDDRVMFVEETQSEIDDRIARIDEMLRLTSSLRVLNTRSQVTAVDSESGCGPWLRVISSCKKDGSFLWSDDMALRRLAIAEGVESFGTLDLIRALENRGHVDAGAHFEALIDITRAYAVDLPPDIDRLRLVASRDGWEPRAVAFFLTRPASWRAKSVCLTLLREACAANLNDTNAVRGWVSSAAFGLSQMSPDESAVGQTVSQLMAGLAMEPISSPTYVRALLEGVRSGVRENFPELDPWPTAVSMIHKSHLTVLGEQRSAEHLLNLGRALEDSDRVALVEKIISRNR
jgi:tetratricopeptide (TPR) repeat protein